MIKLIKSIFFAIMVILVASCSSSRKGISSSKIGDSTINVSRMTENDMKTALTSQLTLDQKWSRVRVPLSFTLKQPVYFSVNGTVVMEHDKKIQISFSMLGFEVALLYVDDEKLLIIDKYHKQYLSEPIDRLFSEYGFNLSNIQSLILGQPFILGQLSSQKPDFENLTFIKENVGKYDDKPQFWCFSSEMMNGKEYKLRFDNNNYLTNFIADAGAGRIIETDYSRQYSNDEGIFAGVTSIDIPLKHNKFDMVSAFFEWNFSKAKWDKDVEIKSIKLPSDYRRITIEQLLQILGENSPR